MGAIRHMRQHGIGALEPRAEEQARFIAEVDRHMGGTVWTAGGCASWYIDATGRNSTLWPGFTFSFRRRCRFRPAEYAAQPKVAALQKGTPSANLPGSAALRA
jgi:hypothetical protein